ncbi:hypothetical protein R1sor_019355 [Riccia sorocarpa]|uniref:Pru domain-containing protein n=1 Tax=Riccia sorocarpa TaxID=122646 RepID=A0ABD3ICA7_9MARC
MDSSNGRAEDVGSSDVEEDELRATHNSMSLSNQEDGLSHAGTLQQRDGESLGPITPVITTAASSRLSSCNVSNMIFPMRFNAELSEAWTGTSDSENSIRSGALACQSSALGRAGYTESIDVVSRSGLACQIRQNSTRSSCLFGSSTVEQTRQNLGYVPLQEAVTDSGDGFGPESSEDLNRESGALRWVQALELQGTGACRADERLRPLLRWNVSCVGADGRLLVQFGQHFKAKELNMLARCLCAPLVHLRVGRVLRQGRLLRPITSRGFLSLRIIPGSDLRLSFIPDGGVEDLIATISSESETPPVILEEVPADVSGRTFLLKLFDGKVFYFWQSEKSKTSGDELVSKMKDILNRRPALSDLTGIEESRLDSFTSYVYSALNALSSTETGEPAASAASVEIPHSFNPLSAIPYTSRTDPRASPPETRTLSLPASFTRWNSDFEGGSPPCGGGLSEVVSHREESRLHGVASSATSTSSPASWPDSFERRNVTLRGEGLSSVCHSAGLRGSTESSSSNTHDQPVLPAASWSTRTSLSDSCKESSSLSAGLYTSLNADLKGHGHNVFGNQYRACPVAPQGIAASSLRSSMPTFLGEAAPTSCTRSPQSSHPPVSPASLLAPYYCPCPLGSFAPPYVPSSTDGGLFSPSAPVFSVRPPASLFPAGSLSFHEFSLSPVQLPVSTLVTAAIPIQSSGVTPVCSQPFSSVPILHKSNKYMVRTSSASSGFSGTTSEGLDKPFYSGSNARQLIHDEGCSVNSSASLCPGVSPWRPPSSFEALIPVFDSSVSLNATISLTGTSCVNPSSESAMRTQRAVLDRKLAGTRGLRSVSESGFSTQTHTIFTSNSLSQVTPFELGLPYASRILEVDRETTTPSIGCQVSSISVDFKLAADSKMGIVAAQHSLRRSTAGGGSLTGELNPGFHSGSTQGSSHATVDDMAEIKSLHSEETLSEEAGKDI